MPRGPSVRPAPPVDAESAAEEAALRQALERAAAPVPPGPVPVPDRPGQAGRVKETEPVRGAVIQGRTRGARSFVLQRKGRRKRDESSAGKAAPDPRGRGGRVDLRV
ncbi:MAG: hypothetical protein JO332_14165 [Planctomycetaceae bacterium]|nr:hypothetical protein [Planctomycetaceae bacterium]